MILNIFDFDDTLYRIPSHTGAPKEFDISGDVHKWYDHPESLDFTKHRVQLIETVGNIAKSTFKQSDSTNVLITRRVPTLASEVLNVLKRDGIEFDQYHLIGHGPKNAKTDVLAKILAVDFKDQLISCVCIFEDSMFQILQYVEFFKKLHYPIKINVKYYFVDKTHLIQLYNPNGEVFSKLELKD